jgi:hypothetical protein
MRLLRALRLIQRGLRVNPAWQLALEMLIRILANYNASLDAQQQKTYRKEGGYDMDGWVRQCGVAEGQLYGYSLPCGINYVQKTSDLSRTSYFSGGRWWRDFLKNIRAIQNSPGYSYVDVVGTFSKPGTVGNPPPISIPDIDFPMPEAPPWAAAGPDFSKPGDGPIGAAPPVKYWKARSGQDSGYGTQTGSGGSTAGWGPPPPLRRPTKGEKERKVRVVAGGIVRTVVDQTSEVRDFVEALWDALPKEFKKHKTINRPWPYRSEKPKLFEMMSDLYGAWDKLGLDYFNKAFDNVIENQLEDWFYGRLGKAGGQAGGALGKPVGVGLGSVL